MASPGSQTLDPDQRSDVSNPSPRLARARSKRLPKTNSAYDNVASWHFSDATAGLRSVCCWGKSGSRDCVARLPSLTQSGYLLTIVIRGIIKRRVTLDDEKMTSTLFQFVAVVAGVAILATGLIVFPRAGMRGLAKGLAVTVSLAVITAFLITAAR